MSESMRAMSIWLIPGCPLVAAILVGALGPIFFRGRGHRLVIAALIVSCALSLFRLWEVARDARPELPGGHAPASASAEQAAAGAPAGRVARGFDWLWAGGIRIRIDAEADPLSSVMLATVTFVSLLVAVYAGGYMHGDPGFSRFFAELSLFVFSMCMLVLARNFLVLFVFWEGVGLCSYLLIGFWFQRPAAASAARKAFIMNRIGDAAFLIGVFLIWRTFGSLDFADVFRDAATHATSPTYSHRILLICLCLFVGACGKSAQFPLHLWLPDAMEGPSPVSALIHAATMVTAGVYLVARCTPLFVLAPDAQAVVATIGGVTAVMAAIIGLTQNDLKRVLAYSTVSQLGYMFLALGSAAAGTGLAAAAATAAIFHMFTHAFFKALLFLASGNVMHAMGDVLDMRRFGGLKAVLPTTNLTFLCGAGALSGLPLLSGFWSKDEIIGMLHTGAHQGPYTTLFLVLFWAAQFAAGLTAFYTFRAYFRTFWGTLQIPPEAYAHAHAADAHASAEGARSTGNGGHAAIHEGPHSMTWPLVVLSVFALGVGLVVGPTHIFAGWVQQTPGFPAAEAEHGADWMLMAGSAVAALAGVGLAAAMYLRPSNLPEQVARISGPFYWLSFNKFYLDEIAAALITFPVNALAFVSALADQGVVDRLVDWIGSIPAAVGRVLRPVQNGLVQTYALVMLFGLAVFLATILQIWVPTIP